MEEERSSNEWLVGKRSTTVQQICLSLPHDLMGKDADWKSVDFGFNTFWIHICTLSGCWSGVCLQVDFQWINPMTRDDINKGMEKIDSITSSGTSLKAFKLTCVDCKIALECGTCKSV